MILSNDSSSMNPFSIVKKSYANPSDARKEWESSESIWNFGIASACDVGLTRGPHEFFTSYHPNPNDYRNIESGDLVWMPCSFVPRFFSEVFREIKHPFVLSFPMEMSHFPLILRMQWMWKVLLTIEESFTFFRKIVITTVQAAK